MVTHQATDQRRVSAVFAALADPTRRRILVKLSSGGESAVSGLARPFRVSRPAISRHLRVLERARLIERRRKGRVHLIRARAAGLKAAQQWITQIAAGWMFSFDRLDVLMKSDQQKGTKP